MNLNHCICDCTCKLRNKLHGQVSHFTPNRNQQYWQFMVSKSTWNNTYLNVLCTSYCWTTQVYDDVLNIVLVMLILATVQVKWDTCTCDLFHGLLEQVTYWTCHLVKKSSISICLLLQRQTNETHTFLYAYTVCMFTTEACNQHMYTVM